MICTAFWLCAQHNTGLSFDPCCNIPSGKAFNSWYGNVETKNKYNQQVAT